MALENYPSTLLFVDHDREFVSSLATRIIELTPAGIVDFHGSYEDYLLSQNMEQRKVTVSRAKPVVAGITTENLASERRI